MTCCGQTRTTRFCPECGKRIDANAALSELLDQCRKNERLYAERFEAWSSNSKIDDKSTKGARANMEKWKARGDALAAAMDKLAELEEK